MGVAMTLKRPQADSLERVSSLELLQPKFRGKVLELLARMKVRGFDPIVWETFRTRARVLELSARGTGIKPNPDGSVPLGMHELGLAADIISASKKWNASPAFWSALGEEAKALGLTWGGVWTRADKPHVQGVRVGQQAEARARFRAHGFDGVEVA